MVVPVQTNANGMMNNIKNLLQNFYAVITVTLGQVLEAITVTSTGSVTSTASVTATATMLLPL